MKKILMILLLNMPLLLAAQKIDDGNFNVEKERMLSLSKAARNFERMPKTELSEGNTTQQYQLPRFNYALPPLAVNIAPLRQQVAPKKDDNPFRNLAKAGFGNYNSSYAELFLTSSQDADWQYKVHALHHSSQTGPVDGKNSGSSLNKIHGELVRFLTNGKIYSNAAFRRDGLHFYGYSPSQSNLIDRNDIHQRFTLTEIRAGYENTDPDATLRYKAEGGFYLFADRYKANEAAFQLASNWDAKLRETSYLTADLILDLINRRDEVGSQTRNLFVFTPKYEMRQEGFVLNAGVRIVADSDSLTNQSKGRFYPIVNASADLVEDRLTAFASFEGNTIRRTFRTMAEENPFLAPNVALAHTNQLWEATGGLRGNISAQLGFQIKVSYGVYRNLHFFANSTADSAKFNILYDKGNVPVFQVHGELSYATGGLKLTGRTGFFGYNTQNLARPWHRPLFTAEFNTSYLVENKLRINSELHHLAGIRAFSPRTGAQINLKPIFDLNLQIDYFINHQFSIFLGGYNLFSQRYQRFLNYDMRQLTVLGGIGIAF
jgi:hypothetical protein